MSTSFRRFRQMQQARRSEWLFRNGDGPTRQSAHQRAPEEDAVQQAFAIELAKDPEIRVSQRKSCSILAVIGEGMKNRPNISGRFFNALGRASVNVIGIAQGSSERNISAVVPREDLSRALRAAHAGSACARAHASGGPASCDPGV